MSRYISRFVSSSSGNRKGEKTMVRVSSSMELKMPTKRSRPSTKKKTIQYIPVILEKALKIPKKRTNSWRRSGTSRDRTRTTASRIYTFPTPGTSTMSNSDALRKATRAKPTPKKMVRVARQTLNVSVQPTVTPKVVFKPTFKTVPAKTNIRKTNLAPKLTVNVSTHSTCKRPASPVHTPYNKNICPRHQSKAYKVAKDSRITTEPVVTVTTPTSKTVTINSPTTVTTKTPTTLTAHSPATVITNTPISETVTVMPKNETHGHQQLKVNVKSSTNLI